MHYTSERIGKFCLECGIGSLCVESARRISEAIGTKKLNGENLTAAIRALHAAKRIFVYNVGGFVVLDAFDLAKNKSGTVANASHDDDGRMHSIYLWGQNTSKAGQRAWPDLDDENEDMNDYELYEGTTADILEIADAMEHDGTNYGKVVAAKLRSEVK